MVIESLQEYLLGCLCAGAFEDAAADSAGRYDTSRVQTTDIILNSVLSRHT